MTPRYHFSQSDWQKFRSLVTYRLVRFEKNKQSWCWGEWNLYNLYGEKLAIIIEINNTYILPAIILLWGIYPTDTLAPVWNDICTKLQLRTATRAQGQQAKLPKVREGQRDITTAETQDLGCLGQKMGLRTDYRWAGGNFSGA